MYSSVALKFKYAGKLHIDGNNQGPSCILGMSAYSGGEFRVWDPSRR
jgi:hypothetical protein